MTETKAELESSEADGTKGRETVKVEEEVESNEGGRCRKWRPKAEGGGW